MISLILSGGLIGAVFFGHFEASRQGEMQPVMMFLFILGGMTAWPVYWGVLTSIISKMISHAYEKTARRLTPVSIGVALIFAYPVMFKDLENVPELFLFGLFLVFAGLIIIAAWERKIIPEIVIFYLLLALMITTQLYSECGYYKLGNLIQTMEGEAPPPWRFRILLPLIIKGFRLIVSAHPTSIMFIFRIFILVMTFVATKRLAQQWVPEGVAIISPALYAFFLYPTYDLIVSTDFPEILFVTLYLLAMLKRKYLWCLILIVLGTMNREVMAFLVVSYLVYFMIKSGKGERKRIIIWSAAQAAAWLVTYLLIIKIIGGGQRFQHKFDKNIAAVKDYFLWLTGQHHDVDPKIWWLANVARIRRLATFAAGAWLIPVLFWKRLPHFILINGMVCSILWIAAGFVKGNIHETRIFYPLLPFIACSIVVVICKAVNSEKKEKE